MAEVVTTRLANGLTVLTRELHHAPVATFWVWYRVGGRNEVAGVTGVSHWVEHMLFKGTPTFRAGDIFRQVTANGGTLNGFTWIDYTTYFETLPADRLDLALRIESDRMSNARFDTDEVSSERTVIISEREGNENEPTWHLDEEVTAAAFKVHPYGNGVIGWKCDLRSMTRDDLYGHYRRYYVPANAVAVAVGDFGTDQLLRRIEELFGGIAAGGSPPEVRSVEPEQEGERRIRLRRPSPTAYFQVAYKAPPASHPDAIPMSVVDAVLSGAKSMGLMGGRAPMGRSSRLYRALVDAGLASHARSSFGLTRDPFLFEISATLRPGVEMAAVEAAAFRVVDELAADGPRDDELARVKKQARAQFAYGTETVTSQAYWLGSLEVVASHRLLDELLDRIEAVTAEDVRRAAQAYLTERNRTVGWLEPAAPGANGRSPGGPAAFVGPFWLTGGSPAGQPPAHSTQSPLEIERRPAENGLVMLGHRNEASQAVVLRAMLRTGGVHDPPDLAGAGRLTGAMLQRGTARHTFEQLNELTDANGISIAADVARQTTEVTVKCLAEDLDLGVEVLAEVLREPIFPADQLEKVRGELMTALREADQDTRSVADRTFRELAYPEDHPFRRRVSGYVETVPRVQVDHLVAHHRRTFRPDLTTVAVAGGARIEDAFDRIERAFDGWRAGGAAPSVDVLPAPRPERARRREVELAGKSQADLVIGLPSVSRRDPDYYALDLGNLILGRLGLNGRIGANVREKQGLAYYSYSELEGGLGPGAWAARAGINPANVERAVEAILAEVGAIRDAPVRDDELADAQNYVTGVLPLALESNDGVARTLLSIELYDLGLDFLARYPGIIRALTKERIQAATRAHLSVDQYALAVARPATS
ncbi:MAG TPA: pitrilysin family protein [Chloroflexota bacterium]|jgi:zinc protease|nr:pitrilysin family protein [Chloroflexota bacterium]